MGHWAVACVFYKYSRRKEVAMKILLTGANGYIGTRLLHLLGEKGHRIVALVRSKRRLAIPDHLEKNVEVLVADLLQPKSLASIPKDIEGAYYLVHSMGKRSSGFSQMEYDCAGNFTKALSKTDCKQIIYLSGLSHGKDLSEHMRSRHQVEKVLQQGSVPVTIFRAGIIIGSGSASFEILRDLVEKLPMMVAPKWVQSQCQPIAVSDVVWYLIEALGKGGCLDRRFEIGGPEAITYFEMLNRLAKLRRLKRWILPVPVLSPRLSSYWLIFVTSTSFPLAQALVDSLRHDAVCRDQSVDQILPHQCLTYEEALRRAFAKIEQNAVVSSWRDAIVRSQLDSNLKHYIQIPVHGCMQEIIEYDYDNRWEVIDKLWSIGGHTGWYYMNWAWVLRGWIDKWIGGVGLRRGRTNAVQLKNGDVLDFWRVLLADKATGRLQLYAEMKLPGEAWLEFECIGQEKQGKLRQTATFRPKGIFGRFYWYVLYPFHYLIFRGLCRAIAKG